jgi:hypothetical protein
MKIDKKLTTMAFAAAFITSAASAQAVTSWTDSSAAVSAVGAANLSAVEAQIENLKTYIANEQQYQAKLNGANGANDIQIGLDQANLDSATTSATSAATALIDANAALVTAQAALANEILGTPEYTAAEQARDDAQLAVDAATTLNTNAQTALTQAQASFDASTARKTAIEGAFDRSENRVTGAEAAKVTIQAGIDAKNDSFDGINTALAQYGEGIFGADGVNNLDGIIATLDAVVADDNGINDPVDPATLPVADTGDDLTTAYLNDTTNDPTSVAAYVAEAYAALASLTAPVTAAEQAALLDTIGNGAFERQAITEIATNGIDGIVSKAEDGSIHIGENSLITNEVGGVQQLYAQDAGGTAINIDVTNGSNLLINGDAVATEVYATNADTAQSTALTTAFTNADTAQSTALTTAFTNADTAQSTALTTAFTNADTAQSTALTTAFTAADANLQSQVDVNRADIDRNARGIAMVAALTHTTVLPGMTHALDVSAAHFEGETGMAISYSRRFKDGVQINFGAASTTDFDESVVRGGIGWQW